MSTLADLFLGEHMRATAESEPHAIRLRREVQGWLKDTPVIVINDVAKYFFDVFWEERGTLKDPDFPSLAPPFPFFWMEYHVQSTITGGEPPQTVTMAFGGKRIGFYWLARDQPDARGGWELTSLTFVEESGLTLGPVFSARINTDPQGQIVELLGQGIEADDSEPPEEEKESFGDEMITLHYPSMLAICFMNCTNVKTIDHKPKDGNRRRFQKLYGRPPVVYKTLDIAPMLRVISSQGGPGCGAKEALHIMRGHFKRFEERPLFGKHRGMWWWPSQVRGTLTHGYVKKTYEVHPPKEDKPDD
jgi:hypothetical protein